VGRFGEEGWNSSLTWSVKVEKKGKKKIEDKPGRGGRENKKQKKKKKHIQRKHGKAKLFSKEKITSADKQRDMTREKKHKCRKKWRG